MTTQSMDVVSINISQTSPSPDYEYFLQAAIDGHIPFWIQTIYFTYAAIIFILGIPGNIIIILVYSRFTTRKACDWFILFIGINDFAVCLISPLLCLHTELDLQFPYFNGVICGLEHLIHLAGLTASCLLLTVLSVERYVRVCRTWRPLTPVLSRNISIACLLVSLCFASYPAYPQFNKYECAHIGSLEAETPVNELYISLFIFIVCVVTVVFTYGQVIITLEKHIKVKQRLVGDSVSKRTESCNDNDNDNDDDSKHENQNTGNGLIKTAADDPDDGHFIEIHTSHPVQIIHDGGSTTPAFHKPNGDSGDNNTDALLAYSSPKKRSNGVANNSLNVVQPEYPSGATYLSNINFSVVEEDQEEGSVFYQKDKNVVNTVHDKRILVKKRPDAGSKKLIRERQVTMMLLCVTAIFVGTWFPPMLIYLLGLQGASLFKPGIGSRILYRYCDKIFLLNNITNFPVYYRFNATFRRKAQQVIPKRVRKYCMCCCLRNLDNESQA